MKSFVRGLPWKPPGALRGGFRPLRTPDRLCASVKGRTAYFGRATEGSAPLAYNYSLARGIYGLFCSLTKSSFCAIAVCGLPPPVEVGTSVSAWEASDCDYHKSTLIYPRAGRFPRHSASRLGAFSATFPFAGVSHGGLFAIDIYLPF